MPTPRERYIEGERAAYDLACTHFHLNTAGLMEWKRLAKNRIEAFAMMEARAEAHGPKTLQQHIDEVVREIFGD